MKEGQYEGFFKRPWACNEEGGSLMGLPVCDQLEAYYIALNRHGLADQRVQIAFVYFKSISGTLGTEQTLGHSRTFDADQVDQE